MKRISITKAFFVILIIIAVLVGAFFAFIFINPNVLGLISSDGRVTISVEDYNQLMDMYSKYGKAEEVWDMVENQYYTEVKDEDLKTALIKGLVAGTGDIYSDYYTKEEYEDILVSLTGEYDGVGITMTQADNGYIQVLGVTKGSPAEKAGVEIGEYIIKVEGKTYTKETMDMAAAAIRGKAGTKVKVTFVNNQGEEIEREFKRAHITSQTVEAKILEDNIAYIAISSFENATADDFKEALKSVASADSLVLDLRDNPGGMVDSAVKIADMFMDAATVVYTEDHDGNREYFKTKAGKLWDKPFVTIVNENSASASEILAAGLQDNHVCKLVGTNTFGKGIIQSLEQFKDGSAIKLTKWQYFTPSGKPIHKAGIRPEYINDDPDAQLEKAIELLK